MSFKVRLYTIEKYDRSTKQPTGTGKEYECLANTPFSVLSPTLRLATGDAVSVYNYVQPIVSVIVSVAVGLSVFTLPQGVAVILVFSGVWLVIKSKSKRDEEKRGKNAKLNDVC